MDGPAEIVSPAAVMHRTGMNAKPLNHLILIYRVDVL
jgi:hypothetical protein